jgi:hypothetical protein
LRGTIIGFAKKPLFDVYRDLNQPFLCTVGSMLGLHPVSKTPS